jgi:hypothetical protein
MAGQVLESVNNNPYLGVELSSTLSWDTHIGKILTKANNDWLLPSEKKKCSLTDDPIFSPMSLIYSKNINGPNTVPCGTPDLTLTDLDSSPSTTQKPTDFWDLYGEI